MAKVLDMTFQMPSLNFARQAPLPAYQVTAVKMGNVLVADEILLNRISWRDLEKQGLTNVSPVDQAQKLLTKLASGYACSVCAKHCEEENRAPTCSAFIPAEEFLGELREALKG